MIRTMMKSKVHRATVTGAELEYVGSVSMDPTLMRAADILPNEQVYIYNITNGNRFETYAIEGGIHEICLNGAAAHLCKPDDKIIIVTYAQFSSDEVGDWDPTVIFVDDNNEIIK